MEVNVGTNSAAKPVEQLREIVSRTEELLGSLAETTDRAESDLRQRARTTLRNAKSKLGQIDQQARSFASHASERSMTYARENPWKMAAAGIAIGAVLATLAARRR